MSAVRSAIQLLLALAALAAAPLQAQPLAADEFRVTLLGTGSPAPIMKRFGPGVLVQAGGRNLLIDSGRGVTQRLTEPWRTDQTPAFVGNEADPTSRPVTLEPPKNGTVVRIVEFGPEGQWLHELGADGARMAWNAIGTDTASTNRSGAGKHPFMHRTQTVDYCYVLEGEIVLVLDQEEVLMRSGDFAVERGTNHAWANRSQRPCRILFMLIDGSFHPQIARHLGDRPQGHGADTASSSNAGTPS